MARRPGGLDWLDVMIQTGVTFALAVAVSGAARENPEAPIGIVVAASLGILAWRRARAQRQAPALTTGEVEAERIFALEDRVAELEGQLGRMLELEERLDFTERMLTRQRDADPLRLEPGERP